MKRAGRPKLSFDESSDEAEEGESKPKLPRIQRGVPQLPESKQVEAEKTVPEAQSLAQVAALRAALGLGRTKQEEKQLDSEDLAAQPPKLPASMRDIQTFSEFLRLSPAIQEASMKMSADELTALCETAARLKFFDGELFEAVFVHIRCRIRPRFRGRECPGPPQFHAGCLELVPAEGPIQALCVPVHLPLPARPLPARPRHQVLQFRRPTAASRRTVASRQTSASASNNGRNGTLPLLCGSTPWPAVVLG